MTWTKLSDDFSDDCASLPDSAFRTHVEALIWTMRRETGGYIGATEVRRFAESPHADMAVQELVACGLWSIDGQGFRINHHMEHQPEPDLIAKRRELTNERVKRHRRKKAGLEESPPVEEPFPSRPVPTRPVPGNASRNAVTEDLDPWAVADEVAAEEARSA